MKKHVKIIKKLSIAFKHVFVARLSGMAGPLFVTQVGKPHNHVTQQGNPTYMAVGMRLRISGGSCNPLVPLK